ncbi:hypothetical protein MAPG_04312 [Magnaporthiopsis poae ATCC 64411]|uniref:Ricin B lectin domain-containing protein n=1 Tax=Magnaporthiopsis poae (strain ATCC 64411 / 73-15) TaxID=644358 RepID=A0A0C4DWD6_MAGP6|nr:hypothetical protein MAPG_04312 [Magnaporthiopsis poae ATCC 64411]
MVHLSGLVLAAVAAGSALVQAQVPEGYRAVYMTSMANTKFVVQPKTVAVGSTLVVQPLSSKKEQQWYLKAGVTKIQLAETNWCMDAGAKSNWKDMASIHLRECSTTEPGQVWNVMADGRIAVDASPKPQQCIDLQYLRATAGNPVGLYSCAGLGNSGAKDAGINWPLVNVTKL